MLPLGYFHFEKTPASRQTVHRLIFLAVSKPRLQLRSSEACLAFADATARVPFNRAKKTTEAKSSDDIMCSECLNCKSSQYNID